MRKFVLDVCDSFSISNEGVRVGLVSFSTESKVDIVLGQHNSPDNVASAIRNIIYQGGGTQTDRGLRDMRQLMKSYGRRHSEGAPRFAVVLTDGQ